MIDLQKQRHSLWQQIKTSSFLLPFFFALTSVALLISLISPLASVSAQSNSETLNFQGRLLTSTGGLVPDGVYNVEFNLYNQDSGGSSLWTEDRLNTNAEGVTVRNGYFSVYLGELDAFGAINWDQDLYLGMTIRGTASCAWGSCTPADSEMTPRFKLSAVPYAFRAANVASSSTNAASTNSNDVSITSGNAAGATSDSGNVTIDVGTATGTTGQLLFGTSNASALTFGNGTTNPNYTFQGTGTFTIDSLDCSGNNNNGKLTANASGQVICADDVGGGASSTTINSLSGTLTLQGTANEIEVTDNATDTITIGLPDDVTIGSDLTVTDTLTVGTGTNFCTDFSTFTTCDVVTVQNNQSYTNTSGLIANDSIWSAVSPGSNSTASFISSDIGVIGTGTSDIGQLLASQTSAVNGTSGTVGSLIGSLINTINFGTGDVTNGIGLVVGVGEAGPGAIDNAVGIMVAGVNGSGNTTNLLLGTDIIPSGNYSIYSSSTDSSYFGGDLQISDGSSNYAQIGVQSLAGNYTVDIPTITANDTFCLANLANCGGGTGTDEIISVAADDSSAAAKAAADYVADGTSDEDEINSALTAAAGGKVVLLAGTYVVDGTVLIPNNTTLEGEGQGTIIQLDDIDATDIVIENSDISTGTGVVIRDLVVDGQSDLNTVGDQGGIYLNNMGNVASSRNGATIENVLLYDFSDEAVSLSNSDNTIINVVTVRDSSYAIYLNSSDSNTISNSSVISSTQNIHIISSNNNIIDANKIIDSSYDGIYLNLGSENNTVSSNVIDSSGSNGIYVRESPSNTITGNSLFENGDGIRIQGAAALYNVVSSNNLTRVDGASITISSGANSTTVIGNALSFGTGTAISVSSDQNVITGNTITSNERWGIYLSGADNNIVSENRIHDNGEASSLFHSIILANSDANRITGNYITDTAGTTDAIDISDAASDDNYLSGNIYSGTGASTINDSGTNTIYGGQVDDSDNYVISSIGTIELLNNTNVTGEFTVSSTSTFTDLATFNGGLTIETGDTFTFNNDAFTDLTGTGLQINAGSLEAILGDNIEDAEVDDDITISSAGSVDGGALVNATVTNNKLANSQLAVNTGSGLTGGGNISLGGSRNLSLGDLTADWVQAGGYDIILDNAGSELRILEASGGLYYGEIDVADLSADRLYTFPDADGEVSLLGQVIENAELQNSLVTVTAGTGLTGGGNVSLGGSITLNNAFGTSIDGSEITDGTIEAIDLEVTGAPTDDYILTYDSASGGFTWIDPAAAGVTLSEAEVEDFIFDGDNGAKVLSSGTLALGSLSYTGVLTDTYISDTLTVGVSSTVDDGALSANVTLLGSSIALGSETTGNYVESITTGNGLQGGTSGVGSTPTLELGALTANWNQSGDFDIVLDAADSQLQILGDGGSYYGEFNVAAIGSDQTYSFNEGGTILSTGNVASYATTGVTAGNGLTGGGTVGVLNLNIGAGTGLTVNADDIEVNYGSSAGTAVEGDTTVTVTAGTGLSGGGLLTLGAGGTVTLNSNLGDDIDSSEIVDGTIQEEDLETTNAATDTYVLTYDQTSGGFTWVSQAAVGSAGGSGVTSLNSLTGALSITGSSHINVSPSGSTINLTVNADSIGNSVLEYDTGQHLTTTSSPTFADINTGNGAQEVNTIAGYLGDQNLRTSDSVTFNQVTLGSGVLSATGTTATLYLDGDGWGGSYGTNNFSINGVNSAGIFIDDNNNTANAEFVIGKDAADPSGLNYVELFYLGEDGNTNIAIGDLQTNGTTRLTNAGILQNVTYQGNSIDDAYIDDDITINSSGTVAGAAITNDTITENKLDISNAENSGWLLTSDGAGGFTWVDGGTVGTTLSEAEVEAYIFDGDNSGTLSSGTLALNSLSYTGTLGVANGGTGISSAGSAGSVFFSNGSTFANTGVGTSGQCLLSAGAGTPTWGNCGGSGAGAVTLQVAYDQGNTITTTNNRNIAYTLANTATDSDFIVNIATSSTGEVSFQYNSSTLFRVDSGGIDLLDVDVADFTGATVTFDAGEILETEIAQNTLDDSEIQDNSLSASSLATDSVDSDEIAADAVGSDEIATDAVGITEIAANAVSTSELASTSVGAGSYGSAGSVATFTVDGDGRLTAAGNTAIAISGTQVTSGTINDARLSSNVALLDATQSFSGTNTFTGAGTALSVTNNASIGGTLTVTNQSNLASIDASASVNGTAFSFVNGDVTTGEQDVFVIEDQDGGGGSQDESSSLKVLRSGAFNTNDDGSSVFELSYSGGTAAADRQFLMLGRLNDEGEVGFGIAANDLDVWTQGAVRAGATGTDCGATGAACFNSPSISLEADGSIEQSGSTILTTGGVLQNVTNADASSFFTGGALPVNRGGTGATTLTNGGVLLGSGTGAVSNTGVLGNGQLIIGDGSGDPTIATLTQGTGINISNGAGSITIASTLGTNIDSSEIVNGTIAEVDLDISNSETAGYVLTSDGSGGFTWVDPGTVGSTLDEATVESYIFDADNSGTLSSGTLALNSLSYTGDLNDAQVANDLTISSSGTVDGGALTAGTVANGALANSSVTIGTGSGLTGGGGVSLGGSLSLSLSALTGDWNQTGAFDIVLNNASSELRILESSGATYYGTFDVGNLSSNQTYTFNQGGTVVTSGNASTYATTGVTAGNGLTGGGTNGVLSLDVGAGTGILVNANDIEVEYGSTAGTAVEGNTQITISPGTGITGGGSITLGSGGSVTITNELGDSIASNEIVNGTIQEIDLEVTNAGTDNWVLSYDNATGGFTWVDPAGVGGTNEAQVEAWIFDGDNSGTLSSGTLALNSLSYTGTLGVANGGTGLSSAGSSGTVYYSNGTGFANTAVGSSGECLKSNGAGVPYWSECGGSGSGSSLQIAYDEGNTITTTNNRNIEFNLADTSTDSDFLINLQGAGSLFDVQDQGTSKLTVDGAGNVGINDATPSYQLDVAGTGRFTNNLLVDGNTTLGNAATDVTTVTGDANFNSGLLFVDESAGAVGAGTVGPEVKLHVDGGTDASLVGGSGYFQIGSTSGPNMIFDDNEIIARNNGAANTLFLNAGSGNTIINSGLTGNVGIGDTNPTQPLTVLGEIRATNELGETNTLDIGHGGSNAYIDWSGAGDLDFRFGGTNHWSLQQSGTLHSYAATNETILSWGSSAGITKITDQGGAFFRTDSSLVIHAGDAGNVVADTGIVAGTSSENLWLTADSSVLLRTNNQNDTAEELLEFTPAGILQFENKTQAKINLWGSSYGLGVSSNTLQVWSGSIIDFNDGAYNGTTRISLNVGTGAATFNGTVAANNGISVDGNTVIDNGAGWHRVYGDTGFYNSTHTIGIYATDTNWIRAYSAGAGFLAPRFYASNYMEADDYRVHNYGWALRHNADTDTGIYHASDGNLRIYANNQIKISTTGGNVNFNAPVYNDHQYQVNNNVGTMCWDSLTVAGNDLYGRCISLRSVKKNIADLDMGLDTVRQLSPRKFDWKNGGFADFGFIADEVEAVDPRLAEYSDGELTGVHYLHMSALSINAIKELDVQVQSHASRISVLESPTSNLTKKNFTVTNLTQTFRLKVTGLTELVDLKVSGDTEVADITVNGKIITAGNEPTAVLGATTTGNGSTYTIDGNDTAGTITFTTGTDTVANPLAAGTQVTVTFDEAFDEVPRVNLTPINSKSATVDYYVTRTETSFKVRFVNVPDASTSYSFDYQILQ